MGRTKSSRSKPRRAPKAAKPASGAARRPGKSKPLILVVDDYGDAREMFAEYLTFSGFRVAVAANGEEAVEKAISLKPDVVLMDLSLPVLDGWEATRRLKNDPRAAGVKVLAVTGHTLSGSKEEARGAGCDGFIAKPCLPSDLVAEIRKVLAH